MTSKAMELHLAKWASWVPHALVTLNFFCSFWNATVFLKKLLFLGNFVFSLPVWSSGPLRNSAFAGSQLWPLQPTQATGTSYNQKDVTNKGRNIACTLARKLIEPFCFLRLHGKKRWSFPWHSPACWLFKKAIKWPSDLLARTNTFENIRFQTHSHGHTTTRTDSPLV